MVNLVLRTTVLLVLVGDAALASWTFADSWILAIKAWGLALGIAVGWLPSALAATVVAATALYALSAIGSAAGLLTVRTLQARRNKASLETQE